MKNGTKGPNQATRLFNHMMEGYSLTQRSALMDFNVMALPRRISDIEEAGYEVTRRMEINNHTGQRYARYLMTERQPARNADARDGCGTKWLSVKPSEMPEGHTVHFLGCKGDPQSVGLFAQDVIEKSRDARGRALGIVGTFDKAENWAKSDFAGNTQVVTDGTAEAMGMEFAVQSCVPSARYPIV